MGKDECESAAVRIDQLGAECEELHGDVGVGPTASLARAATRGGAGQLRQEGWVADDEVVSAVRPRAREGVVQVDRGRRNTRSRHPNRSQIDVAAMEYDLAAEQSDALGCRSEEPPVTAGRVEHGDRTTRSECDELGGDHGVDNRADQINGCVERTEQLGVGPGGHDRTLRVQFATITGRRRAGCSGIAGRRAIYSRRRDRAGRP